MKKPVLLKEKFQNSLLSFSPENKMCKSVTEGHKGLRMQIDKETEKSSLWLGRCVIVGYKEKQGGQRWWQVFGETIAWHLNIAKMLACRRDVNNFGH